MFVVKHVHNEVRRGGGPPGYLYNLRRAVDTFGHDVDVQLLVPGMAPPGKPNIAVRMLGRLKRELSGRRRAGSIVTDFHDAFGERMRFFHSAYDWVTKAEVDRIFSCDMVCVHNLFLAEYLQRVAPREASSKLALMTHSPTFITHEIAADMAPDTPEPILNDVEIVRENLEREIAVMSAARWMIWPCPEAQMGYPEWHALYSRGAVDGVWAETGVFRPEPQATREEMRASWGIEPDQRVALFIGRPHPHKGFDRFLEWAEYVRYSGRKDWVFVHCGGSTSSGRDMSAVRQVGYVTDNGAAYLAGDLVLLPNRHSYFDIGLLEAMSLGAPVAVAPTGGHGYLSRHVPFLPTILSGDAADTWSALETIADEYVETAVGAQLQETWRQRFSPEAFVRNHSNVARQVLGAAESLHHRLPAADSSGKIAATG